MSGLNFSRRHLLALPAAALAAPARAQAWPTRPVRIVVPFAPGGNTDGLARVTADILSRAIGTQFIVENRSGAGGLLANENVARATDGHTLMMAAVATIAIAPAAMAQRNPIDPVTAFAPVSMVATNPFVLLVHQSTPATTLAEFIALMKSGQGQMAYASGGVGSLQHLTMLLLAQRAGFTGNHIPYRGGGPAITDLLAGAVPALFANLSEALPHRGNPAIRLLAVSGAQRAAALPEVPTVAETLPGFETITWNGLVAPAGFPDPAIRRVQGILAALRDDAATRATFAGLGADYVASTPEFFGQRIVADVKEWGELIRVSGIRIE
jgi:tripartite-type tricarboxylate transporter receptor subunit TctC